MLENDMSTHVFVIHDKTFLIMSAFVFVFISTLFLLDRMHMMHHISWDYKSLQKLQDN